MYKDKLFTQKYMRFYHDLAKHIYIYIYLRIFTNEKESLYYIIENLIENKIRYIRFRYFPYLYLPCIVFINSSLFYSRFS